MDLARRDIDADVEYSGSLQRRNDSRGITGGLRVVMKPARDGVDGHATCSGNNVRDNSGAPWPLRLPDLHLPRYGANQVIGGIRAADRPVGIQYELTAARAGEDQAEAGRNGFR